MIKETIMDSPTEHEEKSVAPDRPDHKERNVAQDGKKSLDGKAADDSTSPSKAIFLKRIVNYAILGFAPVVAILALVIAVIAVTGNQPGQTNQASQTQFSKAATEIDGMSASLSASKDELERLKAAMAHEKTRQEERMTIIIRNITELQVIMHISPTLDEELHQPAKASAPTSSVTSAATAPAAETVTKVTDKKPNILRTQDLKEALEKLNKK